MNSYILGGILSVQPWSVIDPKACLVLLMESIQPRRHNFHNKEIFTPSQNRLISCRYLFWGCPLILCYHSFFFFFGCVTEFPDQGLNLGFSIVKVP